MRTTTDRLGPDQCGRARTRALLAMAVTTAIIGALLGISSPSNADVTATRGEAYGYFASVSLLGGPAMVRGPAPIVTLPATGANPALTANVAESIVQYGPAIIFSSGSITVSTGGTLGPG